MVFLKGYFKHFCSPVQKALWGIFSSWWRGNHTACCLLSSRRMKYIKWIFFQNFVMLQYTESRVHIFHPESLSSHCIPIFRISIDSRTQNFIFFNACKFCYLFHVSWGKNLRLPRYKFKEEKQAGFYNVIFQFPANFS